MPRPSNASKLSSMRLKPMSVARKNFSLLAAPGNPTLPAPNKNLPSSSRRKIKSRSVTGCLSVFTRFACADVNALPVMHLNLDCLITAVTTNIDAHMVAALFQFALRLCGNAAFKIHVAAVFHLLAGRFVVALVLPARRIARFLHIQTEIDLVRQHLNMTLRLHSAAHHAECLPRFAVFHHKSGNDRMKRTLAWCVNIRVTRFHREKFAAILKHESESRHYDAASHPAIIALNERDHVAFIVGRAHVNSVAVVDLTGGDSFHRATRIDQLPTLGRVIF